MKMPKFIFHGGCAGCTQQEKRGTEFCYDCCFFDAQWEKPNLNNRPLTEAEKERCRIKQIREEMK